MGPLEKIGHNLGTLLAPLTYFGSHVRQARLFHPTGVLFRGEVETTGADALVGLAGRLEGEALVRISSSLWRRGIELPDAWGCALRFGWTQADGTEVAEDHQDLIFASFKTLLGLPFAPLTSKSGDFTSNVLHTVVPFSSGGETVRFSLRPLRARFAKGKDRWERLESWQRSGRAELMLACQRWGRRQPWRNLATIRLVEKIELDQNQLGFSPFHAGKGIHPVGLVNHIRQATYEASQRARAKYVEALPYRKAA